VSETLPAEVEGDIALAAATGALQPLPPVTVTVPVGVPAPGAVNRHGPFTVKGWPTTVAVARSEEFVMLTVVAAAVHLVADAGASCWR